MSVCCQRGDDSKSATEPMVWARSGCVFHDPYDRADLHQFHERRLHDIRYLAFEIVLPDGRSLGRYGSPAGRSPRDPVTDPSVRPRSRIDRPHRISLPARFGVGFGAIGEPPWLPSTLYDMLSALIAPFVVPDDGETQPIGACCPTTGSDYGLTSSRPSSNITRNVLRLITVPSAMVSGPSPAPPELGPPTS